MKLTLNEITKLKILMVKSHEFELASKFREQEKKILKRLPQYKIRQLIQEPPAGVWVTIDSVHIPNVTSTE